MKTMQQADHPSKPATGAEKGRLVMTAGAAGLAGLRQRDVPSSLPRVVT